MALDVLELPLDRGLIADEHQSPAMLGRRFPQLHLGTERDTSANDAMPLRLRQRHVVARIDFTNMSREWTLLLESITAEPEIVVAPVVVTEHRIVAQQCQFQWRAALPSPDHSRGQQLWVHPEPYRLFPNKPAKLRHLLLQTPEHHVRAVAHPRRCRFRGRARFDRVFRMLARIAEHKLARPDQILPL